MRECSDLDLGVLKKAEKQKRTASKLTRCSSLETFMSGPVISGAYYNKKGEKRWHGTRDLKSSQCLALNCVNAHVCVRAYPDGFGENLRRAYERHLEGQPRRDLRFKVQTSSHVCPVQQFQELPTGDLWEDANLLECFRYCMSSKHLRLRCGCGSLSLCGLGLCCSCCLNACSSNEGSNMFLFAREDATRVEICDGGLCPGL